MRIVLIQKENARQPPSAQQVPADTASFPDSTRGTRAKQPRRRPDGGCNMTPEHQHAGEASPSTLAAATLFVMTRFAERPCP
jgi:hypothetical protein